MKKSEPSSMKLLDEKIRNAKSAKAMADKVQERIKGKRRVPHPTIKKAWIYV